MASGFGTAVCFLAGASLLLGLVGFGAIRSKPIRVDEGKGQSPSCALLPFLRFLVGEGFRY